jgi:hypothetical protein
MNRRQSTKKSGTKGKAEGSSAMRVNEGGDLAAMLSAVMSHPDIPAELYNTIGDWLNDEFHDGFKISERWVIARALDRAGQKGEAE